MQAMMQPMDRNPIDPTWYGVILGAIFRILQLIYQGGSGGGGVLAVESHFHLLKKTVSLYASLSLISLTSGNPLPSLQTLLDFHFSLPSWLLLPHTLQLFPPSFGGCLISRAFARSIICY
ncbi:hypothetical protein AAC387_Pa02g4791 [Persea americana]